MHWYEAVVKFFNWEMEIVTERVISYARNYSEALKAVAEDYGDGIHSVLISETGEGDPHTYTCLSNDTTPFSFLEDWSNTDIKV